MADIQTFRCDVCGKMRAEDTNHWFVGWYSSLHGPQLRVAPLEQEIMRQVKDMPAAMVFCGENCSMRWFVKEVAKLWEVKTKYASSGA